MSLFTRAQSISPPDFTRVRTRTSSSLAPPLVFRRTYLSRDRVSRHFGVGTSHNGELYLRGDGVTFQWIELILATGTRIRFERTSWGLSFFNAVYEHNSSSGEWFHARLGWVGDSWALRRADGVVMRFQACGPGLPPICSIVEERDADGHVITYRRDAGGRLLRIESASDGWIAVDYDEQGRISRAYASTKEVVRYEYDDRGRLNHVASSSGVARKYDYSDLDEMTKIIDPGKSIENAYEDGRCVKQVNRRADNREPYIFTFTYVVENRDVVQTDASESDGSWRRYRFSPSRRVLFEAWGTAGSDSSTVTYQRDPVTGLTTELTITCAGPRGQQMTHTTSVRPGYEKVVKRDLLQKYCSSETVN